jgi:AraC-like DNA-binding protein
MIVPQRLETVLDRLSQDLYYLRMDSHFQKVGEQRRFFARLVHPEAISSLFEGLTDVHFYLKDADSRFMAANPASLQRYGFADETELVGLTDYDLHPPAMAAAYVEEDRQVMQTGQPMRDQTWLVYDHLRVQRWYLCTKAPLLGRSGKAVGVAASMQPLDQLPKAANPFRELTPAIEHVLENFSTQIRMDSLAGLVGLSVSQLDRRFLAHLQTSPSQYIQRVRINEARNRLSKTQESISGISGQCGFYDQAQLTRLFRKHTGMTPTDYRRRFGMGGS